MNHVELHNALSKDFEALRKGELNPKLAREIFNGAGKIISNCKNELIAMNMGIPIDCPLLEIKKEDCANLLNKESSKELIDKTKLPK